MNIFSKNLKVRNRFLLALLLFFIGIIFFLSGIGETGLIDETPPLFASAGKAMSQSGDWITPKVNGILRFDKPPFYYWLMAIIYSIPGNQSWDQLGSLSARLPSALASLSLFLILGDTILHHHKKSKYKSYLALVGSLGFALSPLVIIWSRTAVSDSLLCGTIGISLLLFWRKFFENNSRNCISPWIILSLAILTKGPVAAVIVMLTLAIFLSTQDDRKRLLLKIRPLQGILITFLVSTPWYLIVFLKEGQSFLDSFFGYHNLQRYTSVVNNHAEPWWFYLFIMIIGSLPFSIFLFHGIFETIKEFITVTTENSKFQNSLYLFALCWLLAVLLFFSISATKLPSYWLPATPAAAILIAKSAQMLINRQKNSSIVWFFTTLILLGVSFALSMSNNWLVLINDPEMPNLLNAIIEDRLLLKARIFIFTLTILSAFFTLKFIPKSIVLLQILFLFGQFFIMNPIRNITDNLRQAPIRQISQKIKYFRKSSEPLAMIGIRKPSLHFYSQQIVFYESNSRIGIINLSERFEKDKRNNLADNPNYDSESFLVVIDRYSFSKEHWKNIKRQELGVYGIYSLIRVNRIDLNKYASNFQKEGLKSDWNVEKFERF